MYVCKIRHERKINLTDLSVSLCTSVACEQKYNDLLFVVLSGDMKRRQRISPFDVDVVTTFQKRLDDSSSAVLGSDV